MNQRDQIRRNEEYEDYRPQPLTVTITTEPRPMHIDNVVRLLEQIGWRASAWMVKSNAEEAAERHRTVRALLERIGRLERRIAELDPPPQDGMRYTGD